MFFQGFKKGECNRDPHGRAPLPPSAKVVLPHQSNLRSAFEIYASALRCTIRQGEIPIAAYFEVKRIGLDRM
jgi:hypothetical protein